MFVFSVTMTEEERQTELWEDAGQPGWHRLPLHGLWVSLLWVASLGLKSHPQPRSRFLEAKHPLPEPMLLPSAQAGCRNEVPASQAGAESAAEPDSTTRQGTSPGLPAPTFPGSPGARIHMTKPQ